jgi:hypothetical protein
VLEVPESSTEAGIQLEATLHSGEDNQKWVIIDTFQSVSVPGKADNQPTISLYPNPAKGEPFYIDLRQNKPVGECMVQVISCDGRVVFSEQYYSPQVIAVQEKFDPQIYFVKIKTEDNSFFHKVVVL